MSLATRCIACGTIFRIVQDQIKVSEGWVRCGRCDTVFNALEGLFDLERDTPPPFPVGTGGTDDTADFDPGVAPPSHGSVNEAPASSFGGSGYPIEPTLPMSLDELPTPQHYGVAADARDSVIPQPEVHELMSGTPGDSVLPPMTHGPGDLPLRTEPYLEGVDLRSPAPADMSWDELVAHEARSFYAGEGRDGDVVVHSDFEDARFPADAAADFGDSAGLSRADSRPAVLSWAASSVGDARDDEDSDARRAPNTAVEIPLVDEPAPDFVRQADRRAFWQRGAVRTLLAGVALLAALVLVGQATFHWRDEMAARWPGSRNLLANACARLGCKVSAPREIDQIVVESTALTRFNAADAYRLTVVLRNRAEHGVAAPHLDLSLTEVNGGLVARRALAPSDFRSPRSELPPRSESTLELMLSTGALRIAGYTVAVFYP